MNDRPMSKRKTNWARREAAALLAALLLLLSACGQLPVAETFTPNLSPTNTHHPLFIPTATNRPTGTPRPTLNVTQLSQATKRKATYQAQQATDQASVATIVVLRSQLPSECENAFILSYSPDYHWLAFSCDANVDELVVINRSGVRYSILPANFNSNWTSATDINIWIFSWSLDSRYLYFFMEPCCIDAIGDYLPFGGMAPLAWGLYRLDTQNGITTLFVRHANKYSFSPTGRRLLYIYRNIYNCAVEACSVDVGIIDLRTGALVTYRLDDYLAAGYVIWSEDGSTAYFSAVQNPTAYSDSPDPTWYSYDYSIYKIDMQEQTITKVIRFEESWSIIYPLELTTDCLILQSDTYDTELNLTTKVLCFDLQSHTITLLLPSNTP